MHSLFNPNFRLSQRVFNGTVQIQTLQYRRPFTDCGICGDVPRRPLEVRYRENGITPIFHPNHKICVRCIYNGNTSMLI